MAVLGGLATGGCREERGAKKPKSGGSSVSAESRVPVTPVTVELREDGLAYVPGTDRLFTGEAVSPHPDAVWLVKTREPFTEGKRDGDKVEYFKNGNIKTLRHYEKGVPRHGANFHRNGQKKFEHVLNAQDRAEGPYQRWYENGMLEATAGLDAEERWHGEFKEWTPQGELKTHHVFEHGLLRRIIFESPESREARLKVGLEVQPVKPEPPPAE